LGTGAAEKCLAFGNSGQDVTPSTVMWTAGPFAGPDRSTLCGWGSARELADNGQAVWELVLIAGTSDRYMLKSSMNAASAQSECLLVRSGDARPYRGLYTGAGAVAGSVYCGFPSAASLLAGGAGSGAGAGAMDWVSAVWTITPLLVS
jgi:hypothetical protein